MPVADFIIEPKGKHDLAYHQSEGWSEAYEERLLWMGSELVADAGLFITTRTVRNLTPNQDELVDTHTHPVAQIYLVTGAPSLSVEASIDGERRMVHSPATIYIPPGRPHSLHFVEGSGTVVAILQNGEYVGAPA